MKSLAEYIIEAQWKWVLDKDIIINELKKQLPEAKLVEVDIDSTFGHDYVSLYINFMDKKDYPHGIVENSARFIFILNDNKIELHTSPHMYLSPFDRSGENPFDPRMKYLAMRSGDNLMKEYYGKGWRKTGYKTEKDIISKVGKYVKDALELMDVYCGGYPYHQGVLTTSISDAMK